MLEKKKKLNLKKKKLNKRLAKVAGLKVSYKFKKNLNLKYYLIKFKKNLFKDFREFILEKRFEKKVRNPIKFYNKRRFFKSSKEEKIFAHEKYFEDLVDCDILKKKKYRNIKLNKKFSLKNKQKTKNNVKPKFFKKYKNKKLIKSIKKPNFFKKGIVNSINLKKLFSKFFLFDHYVKLLKSKKKFLRFFLILFPRMDLNIIIIIKSFWSSFITSDMLAEYFILRLLQKKLVIEIMKPILKFLKKSINKKNIYGYAILLMGRFTRKDRATYKWYKKGPFTKSNRIIFIDYANRKVYLKFSTCSFKINLIKTIGYKKL